MELIPAFSRTQIGRRQSTGFEGRGGACPFGAGGSLLRLAQ